MNASLSALCFEWASIWRVDVPKRGQIVATSSPVMILLPQPLLLLLCMRYVKLEEGLEVRRGDQGPLVLDLLPAATAFIDAGKRFA